MRRQKDKQDYIRLGKERGFEWIGGEIPRNVLEKTKWKCAKGHEFMLRYSKVYEGVGCPQCRRYLTKEDFEIVAEANGVEWVGNEIVMPSNKTLWKIPHLGVVFQDSYRNMLEKAEYGVPVYQRPHIAMKHRVEVGG